ncbi:hypothetical protein CAPTEDRAFT_228292 [Capitella teleta]|uniref:Uncharacterized protein n=1 Tax=Capitella teleta TaxID=283909 RepID=R7USQ7_CAPTE|nr:hypothetical protein CAPTEDRAFT_228292 [Capitella teleta]|eukprot:ELU06441.1 hypothetical protein CAPTEDRAFT_228292 [Capitella teleta]
MDVEARLFCGCCAAFVTFFFLAFLSSELKGDGSLAQFIEDRRQRYAVARERRKEQMLSLVDDKTRAAFFNLEQTWEGVYSSVFTKLSDERPAFWNASQAKTLTPWPRDHPRRPHCGGLGTVIPRLVTLAAHEGRCPPWKWVWALRFEQEKIPQHIKTFV